MGIKKQILPDLEEILSGERLTFSIIIPVLDEEQRLPASLQRVGYLSPESEVIVVDGGSTDGTAAVADQAGVRFERSAAGRGTQCNLGAKLASGEILLFLHVDSTLPIDAFPVLRRCFRDPNVQLGTFRLVFDHPHPVLRLYAPFSRIDSMITRYGDQCIVVRRAFFEALGGFPDWPLFEDVRFLQEARKHTRIVSFPATVTTSARRYLKYGVVRQQLRNLWYMLQYMLGIPPEEIARQYGQVRDR